MYEKVKVKSFFFYKASYINGLFDLGPSYVL